MPFVICPSERKSDPPVRLWFTRYGMSRSKYGACETLAGTRSPSQASRPFLTSTVASSGSGISSAAADDSPAADRLHPQRTMLDRFQLAREHVAINEQEGFVERPIGRRLALREHHADQAVELDFAVFPLVLEFQAIAIDAHHDAGDRLDLAVLFDERDVLSAGAEL